LINEESDISATKAGVLSLLQSCAVAPGPHAGRCNALLPDTIRTRPSGEDLRDGAKRGAMEGWITRGRLGCVDDLVWPAVFLACEQSACVNGASILIDGGLFVNLR
jgi:L-rhamnose 1-dehydrogenase